MQYHSLKHGLGAQHAKLPVFYFSVAAALVGPSAATDADADAPVYSEMCSLARRKRPQRRQPERQPLQELTARVQAQAVGRRVRQREGPRRDVLALHGHPVQQDVHRRQQDGKQKIRCLTTTEINSKNTLSPSRGPVLIWIKPGGPATGAPARARKPRHASGPCTR